MLVCDNPVCDQDIDARTEAERHKKSGKCVTSRMQAQACTPKHLIWLYQTDYTRPWPRHGRARCPTGRLSTPIDTGHAHTLFRPLSYFQSPAAQSSAHHKSTFMSSTRSRCHNSRHRSIVIVFICSAILVIFLGIDL
jgi:hypothetical protein